MDVGGGDPDDVARRVRGGQAGLDVVVGTMGERACSAEESRLVGPLGQYVGELVAGLDRSEGGTQRALMAGVLGDDGRGEGGGGVVGELAVRGPELSRRAEQVKVGPVGGSRKVVPSAGQVVPGAPERVEGACQAIADRVGAGGITLGSAVV